MHRIKQVIFKLIIGMATKIPIVIFLGTLIKLYRIKDQFLYLFYVWNVWYKYLKLWIG